MGRPRDPTADGRLLDATRSLLHDVGYQHLTMEAVALRAGVGKPTLYRRWHSKAELVFELLRTESLVSEVPDTGSFEGDLRAFVETLRDSCQGSDRAMFADQIAMMVLDAGFSRTVCGKRYDDDLDRIYAIWERALARGEVDPAIDGRDVLSDVGSIVAVRVLQMHRELDEHAIEALVRRTVEGVKPRRRRRSTLSQ
jgi:AcrR family transcriptional regulator